MKTTRLSDWFSIIRHSYFFNVRRCNWRTESMSPLNIDILLKSYLLTAWTAIYFVLSKYKNVINVSIQIKQLYICRLRVQQVHIFSYPTLTQLPNQPFVNITLIFLSNNLILLFESPRRFHLFRIYSNITSSHSFRKQRSRRCENNR